MIETSGDRGFGKMNWLAHLLLSEPEVEFRLGNLLADLVKGKARAALPPGVRRGIACHQAIDAFTDAHPVVSRSKRRIGEEHGRFAGILVDVFYDHFLARDWLRYASMPLDDFTAEVYASFHAYASATLPAEAISLLPGLSEGDLLGSYRRVAGIEAALRRLSRRLEVRLGRSFALEQAVEELQTHYDAFGRDFAEFFPELHAHVEAWRAGARGGESRSGFPA
jgi:acyl carrier protein phosphodiesterase